MPIVTLFQSPAAQLAFPFVAGFAVAAAYFVTKARRHAKKCSLSATDLTDAKLINIGDRLNQIGGDTAYSTHYRPRNWILSQESDPGHRVRRMNYSFPDDNRMISLVSFGEHTEGPPGHVHGGCTASVLDALSGGVAYQAVKRPIVTANLSVNYRNGVPLESSFVADGVVTRIEGRKIFIRFRSMPIAVWERLCKEQGTPLPDFPAEEELVPTSATVKEYYQFGTALFIIVG